MNLTPEQKAQNLAAVAARLEGKPAEWISIGTEGNGGEWDAYSGEKFDFNTFFYRPKTAWTLSRHLPGFRPLEDGEEWHVVGMTEAMIYGGWRPLLLGEIRQCDVDQWYDGEWNVCYCNEVISAGHRPSRTRRPLPALKVTRPWSKPEDVPGPVCWIRIKAGPNEINNLEAQIVAVSDRSFTWTTNQFNHLRWDEVDKIRKLEHSTDRKTWFACQVEEDAK